MLNSTVLEVAIGLVFCYCSVSLIASSINEAIASLFKWRAATLLDGVKSLLNDPQFTGLARDLYNHALVNPQHSGRAETEKQLSSRPSYIPSMQFAAALTEILRGLPAPANQNDVFAGLADAQLRQLFNGIYERTGGDPEAFRKELATWFDSGMARVAGGYKRRTQLVCFVIAAIIAGLFNVDSFELFKVLWQHPAYAAAVGASSEPQSAADALAHLKALPIGWASVPPKFELSLEWLVRCAGWLVTASTALFGAPFWFDLLQKIVRLRGTGAKPDPVR